jgi:HPt (histidine-containing phosphotransfer) domain-containing protein
MISFLALSLLEVATGDDELIAELIDSFNTDPHARILQIRTALANSDFSKIRAEAHTIKGGSKQVGAEAVADAWEKLEALSKLQEASLTSSPAQPCPGALGCSVPCDGLLSLSRWPGACNATLDLRRP